MRVIATTIVLIIIFLTFYSNKTMVWYCYVCCLGVIVGNVSVATIIYYFVLTPVLVVDMAHPYDWLFFRV